MAAVEPRRFTVEEYQRMGQAGILREDDRVELIDGQIVEMTPIGPPHVGAVTALIRLLASALGERALLTVQNPVVLGDLSAPQPDLVLMRPREDDYRRALPGPEDILCLIEVSETSGPYDRGVKLALYAESGIPEYWIVDVGRNAIEVYRSPSGERYASVEEHGPDDLISPEALPDIEIAVSDVLGSP